MNSILSELGIINKEDVISNFLVHLINHYPNFKKNFFSLIKLPDYDAFAFTRKSFEYMINGKNKKIVPDILIEIKKENELIIIENKLNAEEGDDQTKNYKLCEKNIKKEMNVTKVHYFFLTLFEDQEPIEKDFQTITYKSLLDQVFLNHNIRGVWGTILDDFMRELNIFYNYKASSEDKIFEKLRTEDNKLHKNFNYFKSLFSSIEETGLEVDGCWRDNSQGHPFYGIIFSKKSWSSEKANWDEDKKRYLWNIRKPNYYIHIEPQYDLINGTFVINLHYETNPYDGIKPVKDIGDRYYLRPRHRFYDFIFKKFKGTEWQMKSDYSVSINNRKKAKNQVAILNPSWLNELITFSVFKKHFIENIKIIEQIIDEAVKKELL